VVIAIPQIQNIKFTNCKELFGEKVSKVIFLLLEVKFNLRKVPFPKRKNDLAK